METDDCSFIGRSYAAEDGLKLYYRDYGDALWTATPVLCLAGLTQNSADFHDLACRISARGRRVIAPDYRGRGRSSFDPVWQNYSAEGQLGDIEALLIALNLHRVIVIGTSFGGLLAMALSVKRPTVLAGVVLNDVGPEIDPNGLARIASYIGTPVTYASFDDAARQLMHAFSPAYPGLPEADWLKMAESSFCRNGNGQLVPDYDLNLGKALAAAGPSPDLWPFFRALEATPCLAVRGELSDILSVETFDRMAAEVSNLTPVVVPQRGHVPLLDEPSFIEAFDEFLEPL